MAEGTASDYSNLDGKFRQLEEADVGGLALDIDSYIVTSTKLAGFSNGKDTELHLRNEYCLPVKNKKMLKFFKNNMDLGIPAFDITKCTEFLLCGYREDQIFCLQLFPPNNCRLPPAKKEKTRHFIFEERLRDLIGDRNALINQQSRQVAEIDAGRRAEAADAEGEEEAADEIRQQRDDYSAWGQPRGRPLPELLVQLGGIDSELLQNYLELPELLRIIRITWNYRNYFRIILIHRSTSEFQGITRVI